MPISVIQLERGNFNKADFHSVLYFANTSCNETVLRSPFL
jgi:hypothetical protein